MNISFEMHLTSFYGGGGGKKGVGWGGGGRGEESKDDANEYLMAHKLSK